MLCAVRTGSPATKPERLALAAQVSWFELCHELEVRKY